MLFKLLLKLGLKNLYLIGFILLFFALNPLVTESVCWVTERKDVLYCCFYFLAFLQFLKYEQTEKIKNLVSCFFLFVLSCLAKPMAVSFPLLLLLYLFYRSQKPEWKRIIYLLPFFAVSLIVSVVSIGFLREKSSTALLLTKYTLGEKITLVFSEIGFYFFKPFFPVKQQLIHAFPASGHLAATQGLIFFSVLGCCILGALMYVAWENKLVLLLTLAWLIFLLPVLQIFPNTYTYVSERYFYISIIFPVVFVFLALEKLKLKEITVKLLIFVFLISFVTLTFKRSKLWKDTASLFEQELKVERSDPYALNNLGQYYNTKNEFSKAAVLLKQAVRLQPNNSGFLNNYGWSLGGKQQTDSAIVYFNKALTIKPDNVNTLNNLGVAYIKKGNIGLAFSCFNRAYYLDSLNSETVYNMGAYYLKIGNREKGRPFIKRAHQLGNKSAAKYLNS